MNKLPSGERRNPTLANYEPVIGLEIHVELNTKSKMFCQCPADYFGKQPNTHTCPVCLGLPGSTPYINNLAIDGCLKIGLALNCQINKKSLFERKNYFYPDLPKGYQISQLRWPLCINGWIGVIDSHGRTNTIRINRVHQEEDTGKLTHIGNNTLIDFNRSGVPLVEIVTEPDFKDCVEVRDYTKKIQQLVRYLGVSNADMEKGDMRLEANISVRPIGQNQLPNYRVELKNINSFRFLVAAAEYEIRRQTESLKKGKKLIQETRGWDEAKKQTYTQRVKEESNDYRYFPEPDLPVLEIDGPTVSQLKQALPELPHQKIDRYIKSFGLTFSQAVILTDSEALANYFEQTVEHGLKHQIDPKDIANHLINKKVDIEVTMPSQIIEDILGKRSGILDDDQEIEKLVKEVILENPKMVEDYKSGKVMVIQALLGAVMKKAGGKANPKKVRQFLEKHLQVMVNS